MDEIQAKIKRDCANIQKTINNDTKNIIEKFRKTLQLFSSEVKIDYNKINTWCEKYLNKPISSTVNSTLQYLYYSDKENECLIYLKNKNKKEHLNNIDVFQKDIVEQYLRVIIIEFEDVIESLFFQLKEKIKEKNNDKLLKIRNIRGEIKTIQSTIENSIELDEKSQALENLLLFCTGTTASCKKNKIPHRERKK